MLGANMSSHLLRTPRLQMTWSLRATMSLWTHSAPSWFVEIRHQPPNHWIHQMVCHPLCRSKLNQNLSLLQTHPPLKPLPHPHPNHYTSHPFTKIQPRKYTVNSSMLVIHAMPHASLRSSRISGPHPSHRVQPSSTWLSKLYTRHAKRVNHSISCWMCTTR